MNGICCLFLEKAHRAINDKIQPIDMPLIVLSVVLYDTIIHVHLLYSTITLSIKSNQVAV